MKIKRIGAALAAVTALMAVPGSSARAQDKPTPVTGKLPAKAECVVCSAGGEAHGLEKPAAGMQYKGETYYFCNKGEIAEFVKAPESFMPPTLPRPAPAFALKNTSGKEKTLAGLKGQVALIDFWATWCAPCVKAMPDLQKLHDRFAGKGFTVVGVAIDEDGMKSVAPFLAKRKFTYPILLDTENVWQSYGVRAVPALFLVDKSGRIVRQWTGKVDKKEVERAVAELVG